MTTTETRTTCEAATGFYGGEFGMKNAWCGQVRGLRSFIDRTGETRRYCSAPGHREAVERRFGLARYVSEIDGDGLAEAKARKDAAISRIVSLVDVDEDDEDYEFDREGQPEFNGSFR